MLRAIARPLIPFSKNRRNTRSIFLTGNLLKAIDTPPPKKG